MRPNARLGAFLLTLALAFTLAGCGAKDAATPPEQSAPAPDTVQDDAAALPERAPELSAPPSPSAEEPAENTAEAKNAENAETAPPSEPAADLCTLSISCASILDCTDRLDAEKAELVPPDGILLDATEVELAEGESVFDLLQRVCREKKLHMEFTAAPLYGSAYIEGIGNLYEFDCGEGSGWMYRVNGEFPNVGCSQYTLRAGDTVEWLYTCDFGTDVGGSVKE